MGAKTSAHTGAMGAMKRDVVDIGTFLRNIEQEFDGRLAGGLRPETRFHDLGDWTSLQALIVVAGFERDYGVTISADDLGRAETLQDLYGLVVRRIGV